MHNLKDTPNAQKFLRYITFKSVSYLLLTYVTTWHEGLNNVQVHQYLVYFQLVIMDVEQFNIFNTLSIIWTEKLKYYIFLHFIKHSQY